MKMKNEKIRSNILLERQDSKMNAIICDFGLARISSETNVIFFFYFYFYFYFPFHFLLHSFK